MFQSSLRPRHTTKSSWTRNLVGKKSATRRYYAKGFTLNESVLVVGILVAVVSLIIAVGIPTYETYVETANMSRVNAAFEHAIREVRLEYAKDAARVATGQNTNLPVDEGGWIRLFDRNGVDFAPGGGPAYLPAHLAHGQSTGAVYIQYDPNNDYVDIRRPDYLTLVPYRVRITLSGLHFYAEDNDHFEEIFKFFREN